MNIDLHMRLHGRVLLLAIKVGEVQTSSPMALIW